MIRKMQFIVFFFLKSQLFCQGVKSNLISNGSFEDVYHCEYYANYVNDTSDNFFAKSWFILQPTTPDLICSSFENKNLIQVVECGPTSAADGNNFIGMVVLNEYFSNELIINHLMHGLEKDSIYILEFNLYYNESCTKYSVSELNTCLSIEKPKNIKQYLFNPNKRINKKYIASLFKLYNSNELLYNNYKVNLNNIVSNKWNRIQLEITAKGSEEFISIGYVPILNKKDIETNIINKDLSVFNNVKKNDDGYSNKYRFQTYYYFDNFKLYKK